MDQSDIKAAFISKYDTLSESEKLKATVKQLAASKAPVEDVDPNQAVKEKKEGEGDEEEEDDGMGQEEEKKDDGPLVYQVTRAIEMILYFRNLVVVLILSLP